MTSPLMTRWPDVYKRQLQALFPVLDAAFNLFVDGDKLALIHHGAGKQRGAAGLIDLDLAHHLADDNLNVLVVDVNALETVNLLDFLDDVVVDGVGALDGQDVMGID